MKLLEDPELAESDLFRGHSYRATPRDQQCPYCRTWFGPRGIDSHRENCPVVDEEKIDAEAVASILDECEECGYLGHAHAVGCSEVDGDWPLSDWCPVV